MPAEAQLQSLTTNPAVEQSRVTPGSCTIFSGLDASAYRGPASLPDSGKLRSTDLDLARGR
jgi:hypothetical protein